MKEVRKREEREGEELKGARERPKVQECPGMMKANQLLEKMSYKGDQITEKEEGKS